MEKQVLLDKEAKITLKQAMFIPDKSHEHTKQATSGLTQVFDSFVIQVPLIV